jgi:hypothetical protein
MSYSFNVRAHTDEEVIDSIAAEFDKVIASQPIHEADRGQAAAAAEAFLEIIPAPTEDQDYSVSVSGSVGWTGTLGEGAVVTSASVQVSASLVAKQTA